MPSTDPNSYVSRLKAFHSRPHGRAIDDLVYRYVRSLQPNSHGCSLLEIGCGIGILAKQLADSLSMLHITAVDPNYADVAQQLNPHERIGYESDPQAGYVPGVYDAVVCCNVLGHLPHPNTALMNMAESLAPGGLLLLSVPSRLYEQAMTPVNYLKGYRSDPTLLHRWYDWELVRMAGRLGLQLIAKHNVSKKACGLLCESTFFVFSK